MGKLKDKAKNVVNKLTTAKNNTIQTVKKDAKKTVDNVTTAKNNAGKKIVSSTKKVLNNLGEKIQKLKLNKSLGFLALLPFKNTMVKALRRKGVTNVSNNDSIGKISMMFYNIIIYGKTSLEFAYYDKFNHAESESESGEVLTPELKQKAAQAASSYTGGAISEAQANDIIEAITKFIKNLANKKESGQTISVDENAIASDAIADINEIEVDEDGNIVEIWYDTNWFKWLIGISLLIATILLIKYFRS